MKTSSITPRRCDIKGIGIRSKQEIRIIYCFKNRNIYLLHAFKKQTQKTPRKEIETALKRLDMRYHI